MINNYDGGMNEPVFEGGNVEECIVGQEYSKKGILFDSKRDHYDGVNAAHESCTGAISNISYKFD